MGPVSEADGHDLPGSVDELVPGPAAMVENILVGFEHAVGEPVLAHIVPDILHGVQFRRFGRQRDDRDIAGHHKVFGEVPSGLVDDQDGMGTAGDLERDFLQVLAHRPGIAHRQHKTCALALVGADGAKEPGRAGALVVGCRRSCPPLGPAPRDLVLLADPGLVLEPDLYLCAFREGFPDCRHRGGEVFLKAAAASISWA